MLRVVYIHVTGPFGGASRSLFEAIREFPPAEVEATFITQRGTVREFFGRLGRVLEARGLTKFDDTRYSYYRGARWLVLLRELSYAPSTIAVLWRARQICGSADIVHLNEFTGLPVLWLAKRWLRARASVVHVRSVARSDRKSWRTRWIHWMLRNEADAVIAIDETVRASLPSDLEVDVIHNSFSPRSLAAHDAESNRCGICDSGRDAAAREAVNGARRPFRVGFVGNLLVLKGIFELIEAARLTKERGLDIEFIIVGDDAQPSRGIAARVLRVLGLRQNVRAEVEAMLDRYQLRDRVRMLGFTADIAQVYPEMDVLCFPSHYDAPGRPIFEAAFFGVPSIAAVSEPRADTLIDGVTGVAIEPRSADQLARAIERLARDPTATRRMGEAARAMVERNFNVKRNSAKLLEVYRRLAGCQKTMQAVGP